MTAAEAEGGRVFVFLFLFGSMRCGGCGCFSGTRGICGICCGAPVFLFLFLFFAC
jgi:hypothetical protein